MSYNKAFLKFRFRQAGKIIRDIPLLYLLVLSGMLVFLLYIVYDFSQEPTGAILAGVIFLILTGLLHLNRGDYHFIELVEKQPARIYCMDYWLLAISLCLLETINGFYWMAIAILTGCWLISKIRQPRRSTAKGIPPPRFIPAEAFECKAGIRKNGIVFILLYLGSYALLWLPYVSFAFLWLFTCIVADCFQQAEPMRILCAKELPAERFLTWKIKTYGKLYLATIVPVCLLYTLFHPADWIWVALFLLMGTLNITLMIVTKYAAYTPNIKIRAGQVGIGLSLLGIILPFLAPLTLLLLLRKYPTACRNLTSYLYAYN